jgi:hypothetical protein
MNDFFEFAAYEREALKPSDFEKWADQVEKLVGHSLDGDQATDGYSLDYAKEQFDRGISAVLFAQSILTCACDGEAKCTRHSVGDR